VEGHFQFCPRGFSCRFTAANLAQNRPRSEVNPSAKAKPFDDLVAGGDEFRDSVGWQLADLRVPARRFLEKILQGAQTFQRMFVGNLFFVRFVDAILQHRQGGINLALLTFIEHDAEHFPDILHRFKMVALIAHNMDEPDNAPALELAQAVADIGPRDAERLRNGLGVQGRRGKVKERMNLRDRAVDAPARAHLAPMQDKLLPNWAKLSHNFKYFCRFRNYELWGRRQEIYIVDLS